MQGTLKTAGITVVLALGAAGALLVVGSRSSAPALADASIETTPPSPAAPMLSTGSIPAIDWLAHLAQCPSVSVDPAGDCTPSPDLPEVDSSDLRMFEITVPPDNHDLSMMYPTG
ncbi:hypothetical protein [Rhodococcus sp. 3-2]|uniref:hypothetical protein n=1 Tax=Rhodococcus sp. 3-2 TaxID=2890836 RepID=UPI001D185B5E|nr:hypothetical protein [Rhodococcus sp. 3-2]MCC4306248.1 hypothetical protein [Rhodococcus sp. 3-2]